MTYYSPRSSPMDHCEILKSTSFSRPATNNLQKHNQGRARSINANDFTHLREGTKRNWKRYDKALHIINAYALHARLLKYMLATEISGKETTRTASLPTAHLAAKSPKSSSDNDQMVYQTNGTTSRNLSKRESRHKCT